MKISFLTAAAAAAMLVAAPALAAPAQTNTQTTTHPAASSKHVSKPMHKRATTKRMNRTRHHSHVSRMDNRTHMSRMYRSRYDRSATYRDEWNRPMNSGFAPLDFAGNVVGGAIGTAGAIAGTAVGTAGAVAAAPFGQGPYGYSNAYAYDTGDAYAYDRDFAPGYADSGYRYDGTALQYSSNYAARNGFVCQPGTWYTNSFGNRQFCQ